MQCQLGSVVQEPGPHIHHGHPSWDPSDIKREPGIGMDCQGHQGHGPGPGMEDFSPPRDFNPGKVTGFLLMCGQTPTLVFVEGSWPGGPNGGGGDGSGGPGGPPQLQGHPGMHFQPHPGSGPVPGGPPYPPGLPWQYQCPRCDRRFATLQELRSHEPGGGTLVRTPVPGPPHVLPGPGGPRGGHTGRGRGGRGGGRAPRKKKASGNAQTQGRAGGNGTETKEEPTGRFQCSVCEKVFSEEQYYDIHMRINTFKPFPCLICKSHFGSVSSLINHAKNFHKEKHKCPFCTRQYSWKLPLHNHMKEHIEEQILKIVCTEDPLALNEEDIKEENSFDIKTECNLEDNSSQAWQDSVLIKEEIEIAEDLELVGEEATIYFEPEKCVTEDQLNLQDKFPNGENRLAAQSNQKESCGNDIEVIDLGSDDTVEEITAVTSKTAPMLRRLLEQSPAWDEPGTEKQPTFSCKQCGAVTDSASELAALCAWHTGERPFT